MAFAFAFVFALPAIALVALATAFVPMPRLVFRHIDLIIPLIVHEIDRPVAGIVFFTMFSPLFLVPRWDAQVERLMHNAGGYCPDHNGTRKNDLRLWKVSDIETTIKTWLTDADRYADVGSLC